MRLPLSLLLFIAAFSDCASFAANASKDRISREYQLPELVVSDSRKKILHVVALVREQSTLSTISDTVFMFREKLVDFAIPNSTSKYQGWTLPRIISSKSYYRFTDDHGLDSVSDTYLRNFSWCDLINLHLGDTIPPVIRSSENTSDTIRGRYRASRIWSRDSIGATLHLDVLADNANLQRFPFISRFVRDEDLDFRQLDIRYDFDVMPSGLLNAESINSYSMRIESKGRGDERLPVFKRRQSGYVDTYSTTYIIGREYISKKEAEQWRKQRFSFSDADLAIQGIIPPRAAEIDSLIARVENIDRNSIRLDIIPDKDLAGPFVERGKENFKFINRLKMMVKSIIPHRRRSQSYRIQDMIRR